MCSHSRVQPPGFCPGPALYTQYILTTLQSPLVLVSACNLETSAEKLTAFHCEPPEC